MSKQPGRAGRPPRSPEGALVKITLNVTPPAREFLRDFAEWAISESGGSIHTYGETYILAIKSSPLFARFQSSRQASRRKEPPSKSLFPDFPSDTNNGDESLARALEKEEK